MMPESKRQKILQIKPKPKHKLCLNPNLCDKYFTQRVNMEGEGFKLRFTDENLLLHSMFQSKMCEMALRSCSSWTWMFTVSMHF